jgi:ubiquinone/menaquinone biosynthesis C-methylase UbiE
VLTVRFGALALEPGMRLLDLGAGLGRHAFASSQRGAFTVAADLNLGELQSIQNTFAAMTEAEEIPRNLGQGFVQANALNLPFARQTFDRIIASEILEHIDDDHQALSELFRVLKPGGKIAITVPARFPETICWWLNDSYHAPKAEGGHVRIYKKAELKSKITRVGLRVYSSHKAHSLHSIYWWLKCAVGLENQSNFFVKRYHQFLCWDIVKAPKITRLLERLLNPILGKSIVLYADRKDIA